MYIDGAIAAPGQSRERPGLALIPPDYLLTWLALFVFGRRDKDGISRDILGWRFVGAQLWSKFVYVRCRRAISMR